MERISRAFALETMQNAGLEFADLNSQAECYLFKDGLSSCVVSLKQSGRQLWVMGCAQVVPGNMPKSGLPVAEKIAETLGCNEVVFRTVRKGLKRVASKMGYTVQGDFVRKTIQ